MAADRVPYANVARPQASRPQRVDPLLLLLLLLLAPLLARQAAAARHDTTCLWELRAKLEFARSKSLDLSRRVRSSGSLRLFHNGFLIGLLLPLIVADLPLVLLCAKQSSSGAAVPLGAN